MKTIGFQTTTQDCTKVLLKPIGNRLTFTQKSEKTKLDSVD